MHKKTLVQIFIIVALTLISLFAISSITIKFILITIALILSSNLLGFATEQLGEHLNPSVSGFLNATFGNLAEIIIGFFVIKQGHVLLTQASLTGSILGNLIFLVGLAFFIAGLKKTTVKLHANQSDTMSSLLLTSVLFLLFPSMLGLFHEQQYTKIISLLVALILFITYIAYLIFSFITHKNWITPQVKKHGRPDISKTKSLFLMVLSIVFLTILSESISKIIEDITGVWHLSNLFVGAIILGFIGNIAEHLSVLQLAHKGKTDYILSIGVGSSIQIAMFVMPILVFASYLVGNPMTLSFMPLEIFSIFAGVLLANQISKDKSITWLESLQVLGLYIIIAIIFYFAY